MIFSGSRADALTKIAELARQHSLSVEEIATAITALPEEEKRNVGNILTRILSYLGALFVFAGLGIYTGIEWDKLSSLSRVVITLGPGIICFIMGFICLKDKKFQRVATPMFVLGAFLQPVGLTVYLHEYFEPTGNTALALSCVFALVSLQQMIAFKACNRTSLLFFTCVYGYTAAALLLIWLKLDERLWGTLLSASALCTTYAISKTSHRILAPWFTVGSGFAFVCSCFLTLSGSDNPFSLVVLAGVLYSIIILTLTRVLKTPHPVFMFFVITPYLAFMGSALQEMRWASYEWIGMSIGTAGMLAAYGLSSTLHKKTSPILFFIFGFIASCCVHELLLNSPFEVLMIGYGAMLMYLSVVIGSRTLLFVSVVSLLGYLASFTDKYFADVVGWPIALIGLGMVLIIISSYAVKLSQKITAQPRTP